MRTERGLLRNLGLRLFAISAIVCGGLIYTGKTQARIPSEWIITQTPEWLALDFSKPFSLHGADVTIGFEAEFRGPRSTLLVDEKMYGLFPNSRFDYLTKNVQGVLSSNRNMEVDSIPTDNLDSVETQMKEVRDTLGDSLKGFHVHFRVSPSAVNAVGQNTFAGWISRLSDAVVFWRLENRKPFFVLGTTTTRRLSAQDLTERGSLRVEQIDGKIDIEVRGYMGELEECLQLVKIILFGLKHPQYVKGFYDFQLLSERSRDLQTELRSFFRRTLQRDLNSQEQLVLETILSLPRTRHFPLLSFEHAPYFSDSQKKEILLARESFLEKVSQLIQTLSDEEPSLNLSRKTLQSYGALLKEWAQKLNMYESILATSLMPPEVQDHFEFDQTQAAEYLHSSGTFSLPIHSIDLFKPIPTQDLVDWMLNTTEHLEEPQMAGRVLAARFDELSDQTITDLILSTSQNMQRADSAVFSHSSVRLNSILKTLWDSNDDTVQKRVAEVLSVAEKPPFDLVQHVMHSDPSLRKLALPALGNMTPSEALGLFYVLEKMNLDQQEVVLLFRALQRHAGALSAIDMERMMSFDSPFAPGPIAQVIQAWSWHDFDNRTALTSVLINALNSTHGASALNVVEALAEYPARSPQPLRVALRHRDPEIRRKVPKAITLSYLKRDEKIRLLNEARYDRDPVVRSEAQRDFDKMTKDQSAFRTALTLGWSGLRSLFRRRLPILAEPPNETQPDLCAQNLRQSEVGAFNFPPAPSNLEHGQRQEIDR